MRDNAGFLSFKESEPIIHLINISMKAEYTYKKALMNTNIEQNVITEKNIQVL
jgi:hypothetical protein